MCSTGRFPCATEAWWTYSGRRSFLGLIQRWTSTLWMLWYSRLQCTVQGRLDKDSEGSPGLYQYFRIHYMYRTLMVSGFENINVEGSIVSCCVTLLYFGWLFGLSMLIQLWHRSDTICYYFLDLGITIITGWFHYGWSFVPHSWVLLFFRYFLKNYLSIECH